MIDLNRLQYEYDQGILYVYNEKTGDYFDSENDLGQHASEEAAMVWLENLCKIDLNRLQYEYDQGILYVYNEKTGNYFDSEDDLGSHASEEAAMVWLENLCKIELNRLQYEYDQGILYVYNEKTGNYFDSEDDLGSHASEEAAMVWLENLCKEDKKQMINLTHKKCSTGCNGGCTYCFEHHVMENYPNAKAADFEIVLGALYEMRRINHYIMGIPSQNKVERFDHLLIQATKEELFYILIFLLME